MRSDIARVLLCAHVVFVVVVVVVVFVGVQMCLSATPINAAISFAIFIAQIKYGNLC